MEIKRGARIKFPKYINISDPIEIGMSVVGDCVYKFSCFGVDKEGKLTDENYLIFDGHKCSPDKALCADYSENGAVTKAVLDKIPETIDRIVFSVNIDGNGMMNSIESLNVQIGNIGEKKLDFELTAKDFRSEKAIILLEIYRRDGWKLAFPATGFNKGFECILDYFYADEEIIELAEKLEENTSDETAVNEELPPVQTIEEEQEEIPQTTASAENSDDEDEIILPPVQTLENITETVNEIPPVQTLQPSDLEGYEGDDEDEEEDVMPPSEKAEEQSESPEWIFDTEEKAEELPPVRTLADEQYDNSEEETDSASEWIFDADETEETSAVQTAEKADISAENETVSLQADVKNIGGVTARVALVMDMTGSMRRSYASGLVQNVIDKILPLAVKFDDDGQLDFWYYANGFVRRPPITVENCKSAVPYDWNLLMDSLGIINNEPAVIEDVMRRFSQTKLPVYVVFVTDGGAVYPKRIAQLLTEASFMPIYWQFVGINGSNYSIFENLDMIKNRCVSNAGFFALDDLRSISDDYLYDRLLSGFSAWHKEIKRLGMI